MTQWRAFSEHLALDREEKHNASRDMAEYTMSFYDLEYVLARLEAREGPTEFDPASEDNDFNEMMKAMGFNTSTEELEKSKNANMQRDRDRASQEVRPPSARQAVQESLDTVRIRQPKEN